MDYGTVKVYRDDSVTPVVYEHVKHVFWTASDTVLTVAQVTDTATGAHRYVHWPRERFCWYVYEKPAGSVAS
jgi:hypothetical protein